MQGSELTSLINLISKLPGIGPRSARRVVLYLLKNRQLLMEPLSRSLAEVADKLHTCHLCGNLDTKNPCELCGSLNRDRKKICVVESVADLWALERSGVYKGLYHVLGGVLSAIQGVTPQDLTINALLERLEKGSVEEVILALNATIDGVTTTHYLVDTLSMSKVKVSAIAHGIPVGGELDYLDEGTLSTALSARKEYISL